MGIWRTLALVGLALALACGDDDSTVDAGPGDTGAEDAGPPDTGPPPPSTFLGPCVVDEQCPGEGAFCRRSEEGFTLGQCSRTCEDRAQCDDGIVFNHCFDDEVRGGTSCFGRCLNAQDCGRENYVCLGGTGGVCVGYCQNDEQCGPNADCNVHSARCVPVGSVPTDGATTGEACGSDDECLSGNCIPETNGGPTGFNGGYCIGNCILPVGYNTNTFFFEDAYPTEQCPDAHVCYPNGSLARGNAGICLHVCVEDSDCREDDGFFCSRTVQLSSGSKTFDNGVCLPIDCATRMCPAGLTCRRVGEDSVCAR